MNKRMMIAAIAALILIGGGVFFATRGDDNKKASTNSPQGSTSQQSNGSASFSPVSTEGLAFSAAISVDGKDSGTIQSDGKGKISYSSTQAGQNIRIVYTSDAYYSCTGDTCYKYSTSTSSGASFNPSDYQYTNDQLSGYKSGAVNKGRQSCPAGTCNVWSVTVNGATSSIFIDTKTSRISQVESAISGKTTKITYVYKSVTIDVPANAQSLPSQ